MSISEGVRSLFDLNWVPCPVAPQMYFAIFRQPDGVLIAVKKSSLSGKTSLTGRWGAAFILVTGMTLSACSMGPHYPSVDQSKGGIRARIMAVLTAQQVMQAAPACIDASAVADAETWIKAEFRRDRMRSAVIALVPSDIAVNLNDQVELQPEFCGDEKLFHVVHVLRGQVSAPGQSLVP